MRSTIVARAGDAADRLAEALKTAEECVDDCAVAWDDVEELSAAQKDAKEEMQEVAISDADKAFIESTKKTIVTARAAGQVDEATLKEIEAAAKGMKEVSEKVNSKRIAAMQKALEAPSPWRRSARMIAPRRGRRWRRSPPPSLARKTGIKNVTREK